MAIGKKINSLLKKKNMKVTTLANKTNIPPQTLYAIIRRDSTNVDLDILRKICAATEVNISYFYSGHTSVQSDSDSSDASEHITFSAIDLPSTKPNEKHFDIATNNIVLSILENMAEEQDCSPTNIIENILTEQLKIYATDNELAIITEDDDENDYRDDSITTTIADASQESDGDNDTTNTRDTDLPYWMF